MRTEPILKLNNDEEIRSLFYDQSSGSVLVGTSQGRILVINNLSSNAYISGNRTIYSTITNCRGKESEIAHVNIQYGFKEQIIELTNNMVLTKWKSVRGLSSIDSHSNVSGIFTTPILWTGEDFGWWGNATWNQTVGENSRIILAIRVAKTELDLLKSSWVSNEVTKSGNQTWNLDRFSSMGGYGQMKVVLESKLLSENPTISNLILPYYSKHVSYFFTTKMSMIKGSSIRGGLLTASVSVPRNTEVKWGVSSGSGNWKDVIPITPDKLFTLPENFGDRLKVGAKLFVYDAERYPTIDEFSVAFDSDMDNLINSK